MEERRLSCKKEEMKQSKSLTPRPESPSPLSNIEFSLCGNAITLGDKDDIDFMFQAQRIHKSELNKYLNDPDLIIRAGNQYYDAKSAKYLMPSVFDKATDEQLPNLVLLKHKIYSLKKEPLIFPQDNLYIVKKRVREDLKIVVYAVIQHHQIVN